ncbi:MAG: fibronectin type III domain-containing protein [Gammaproteobacteria bacterium]|nr:fibronectin type III domain-containing protein [Gammaproteobacteria bacterium]MCW9055435.1 fibronectin type III domain-containing protein [Gammaproteobacteria bacterium]
MSTLIACSGSSTETTTGITSETNTPFDNTNSNSAASNKTGVVTLSWTPPTENTDESTLTDLSGYKIYYGLSENSLTNSITINNIGLTSYVIENINTNTTYYFSITSINSLNVESDYSNIVSKFITG